MLKKAFNKMGFSTMSQGHNSGKVLRGATPIPLVRISLISKGYDKPHRTKQNKKEGEG